MTDEGGKTTSTKLSGALVWRCIGPHRGGRVVAVAGDPRQPTVFYFGACAGGVWKTTDGGTYWENASDGFFHTAAVGAIAVAESDPNVIYAGMGEACIRGNVAHGDGVYRSTDAGKTWSHLGLADTRHIAKIRIHPQNPDLVYVAALGHAWGPNEERGLYRSHDGGKHWEKILYRSDCAGAIDLSMDPRNPRILYASFWEAQRSPYKLVSGGPGSSLYKSTNGGDTWEELTDKPGLPTGVKGKIGVAVSPARPDRVWALVEAVDGALFRSDDGGQNWQRLSEDPELRRRAWYYTHLYADPQDSETCWVLNLQCWRSTDGGHTFTAIPTPHGDNHDLWMDPRNPERMIEGNDGGACVSFTGGRSWSTIYNQPTAQFYHVITDNQIPYRVYGSQQDNSAITLPSWSINGAITATDWYVPGGGESGYIAVHPSDPTVVFGGAIGSGWGNGLLLRYDRRTEQERNVTAWPVVMGMGEGAKSLKYRFQWTFPLSFSPHDSNRLYAAANRLLLTIDEGANWEPISPDLTRNDPATQEPSGGPITLDNTGAEVYGTIFAFVESPHHQGIFWAGSDDGLVHISRDAGETWENVTPPELPEWALISIIEVSPHDPGTAYLAATRYKQDDISPYLFKTNDYGKSWQKITDGIPQDDFTRVIREDPGCRGLLYAGTETGLYVSFDDGLRWEPMQGNLPVVSIHDLTVKDDEMVVATHGRSFWILDDLAPLRQLAEDASLDSVRLFQPKPTFRFKRYTGYGSKTPEGIVGYRDAGALVYGYRVQRKPNGEIQDILLDAGQNPPDGVIVTYYLPQGVEGDMTLAFLDDAGNELRQFSGKNTLKAEQGDGEVPAAALLAGGAEGRESEAGGGAPSAVEEEEDKELHPTGDAGMNRFVWDLRVSPATRVPGDKATEDLLRGPVVLPGCYEVRLTVDGQVYGQSFQVRMDPRISATPEDLQAQFDLLLLIRDKVTETHNAINRIRDLHQQIEGWEKRLQVPDRENVLQAARALKGKLSEIQDALIQTDSNSPLSRPDRLNFKLAALPYFVDSADARPTQQAYEAFNDLSGQINTQLSLLEETMKSDGAAFNRMIRAADVPAVAVKES